MTEPQGYVIYTLRAGKVDHAARGQELVVRDLAWLNPDAYRSLWRFIASHDLVGRVRWSNAPSDDPAFEYFMEPRMLHSEDREGAWFRVVDAVGALTERGYDEEAELTIGLAADPLTPWNDGTWHLETGPDGARMRPSNETPEIEAVEQSAGIALHGISLRHGTRQLGPARRRCASPRQGERGVPHPSRAAYARPLLTQER